jgi:hypothetical protein
MDMIKKEIDLHLRPLEWMMFQQAIYNARGTDVKDDTDDIIRLVRNRLALHNQAYVVRIGSQCVTDDGHVQGDPGDWRDFYYDWDPRFDKYGESLEEAFSRRDRLHDVGMEAEVEHWGCGWKAMAEYGYGTHEEDIHPLQFMIKIRHEEDSDLLHRATSLIQAKRFMKEEYPEANMISLEISLDLDGKGECFYLVADWDYRENKK